MINLLMNFWYRKQTVLEDFKIFKYVIYSFLAVTLILCTIVFNIIGSFNELFEKIILTNFISMIFTFYNLPTILEEIKSKRSIVLLQMKHHVLYLIFCYLKRNIIIVPYLIGSIINLIYFAFFEPINSLLLLAVLIVQGMLILFAIVSNWFKILYVFCVSIILFSCYINNFFYLISGLIGALLILLRSTPNALHGRYFKKNYCNAFNNHPKNKHINYIFKYLMRIQKKEYIDIIFTSIVAIIIFKIANNYKILSLYFVLFFFAKIQLQIESKQANYHDIYAKNAFFDVRQTPVIEKILYSSEFKSFIMDAISIAIVFIISVTFGHKTILQIIYLFNTLMIMFMYLNKILKVFYIKLHRREYFKGTCVNLILFYIIFFTMNIDLIIRNHFYFLISFLTIILFTMIPIEKILCKNLLGEYKNENGNIKEIV